MLDNSNKHLIMSGAKRLDLLMNEVGEQVGLSFVALWARGVPVGRAVAASGKLKFCRVECPARSPPALCAGIVSPLSLSAFLAGALQFLNQHRESGDLQAESRVPPLKRLDAFS